MVFVGQNCKILYAHIPKEDRLSTHNDVQNYSKANLLSPDDLCVSVVKATE